MSSGNVSKRGSPLHRAIRVLIRPVRGRTRRQRVVIQPYRGYGSERAIRLMGRVLRQSPSGTRTRRYGRLPGDLLDLGRRITRRGLGGAVIAAEFHGAEQRVTCDRDGYFRLQMRLRQPPPPEQLWHPVQLRLLSPEAGSVIAQGFVFIPKPGARHVVISDIDDTVVFTGVANRVRMLWRLFVEGPRSRLAFPGVGAFYRALHRGSGGEERNPLLYVSRGPWGLYELLDEFFHIHDIPVGPILFLREWGVSLLHPFPRQAAGHKAALIREMLALYDELPFILIGDSGQHDPEIYARILQAHPGRVKAIYIRNVSRSAKRRQAIEALADEVVAAGSSLLLASDSFAMARHAAEHGLIASSALEGVLAERAEQHERATPGPITRVSGHPDANGDTPVAHDVLDETLTRTRASPNVVVEGEFRDKETRGKGRDDPN